MRLPLIPVKNTVLYPRLLNPLAVSRPLARAAVEAALQSEEKLIAVFPQRTPVEVPSESDLFRVGTRAVIKQMVTIDHMLHIVVQGLDRLALRKVYRYSPYVEIEADPLPSPKNSDTEAEALHRMVLELAQRMLDLAEPDMKETLNYVLSGVEDTLHQIYLIASLLPLNTAQQEELLAAPSRRQLFSLVYQRLNHEVQVMELRDRIAREVQSEIGKEHRDYLLRKQMEAIQEELGERSPEREEAVELRRRLEEAKLPEEAAKEVERVLSRLERLSAASPEYQLIRNYVDFAISLPWHEATEDSLELERAQGVLDEDHFDLEDVKERIIEHLGVMKLNPGANAPILCFVGPPGVGKTSVGQSIARAMGRRFERMSLGGLHDEAELRGHRRTYIGAMPGRIVQAMRRAGVNNPVLMLDEIDKLGVDFRGDPAAALMEVLDPEQNCAFHDNYLDLPFDLSKVFFITTANSLDPVPRPLLDRMEVIRLSGYSADQKHQIARRYLIPRQLTQAGLGDRDLTIPTNSLEEIITRYTREAGVRELERMIGRVARKVATRRARGDLQPVVVGPKTLHQLLGRERFHPEQMRRDLAPGVAAGLAWTEAGGEVLYVEAALLPEGRKLTLTGQLGTVMQESARAARSYIWSRAAKLGLDPETICRAGVHIHVPAGAVPKDGPSAGIAMATALASLYSGCAARGDTAMTGEITLSGLVLPVGGVKEKVLAAHRTGLRRVILPEENAKELEDMPEHVREELEFIPVREVDEALAAALPELRI